MGASDSGDSSMNRPLRRAALVTLVLAGAVACLDSSEPVAGTLKVVLTKPAGADGAIMFTVAGPSAPVTPGAGAGLVLWGAPFAGRAAVKVLLTGALNTGQTILTFAVNDANKASQYSATILQVAADDGTFAQRNVGPFSGYALQVTK